MKEKQERLHSGVCSRGTWTLKVPQNWCAREEKFVVEWNRWVMGTKCVELVNVIASVDSRWLSYYAHCRVMRLCSYNEGTQATSATIKKLRTASKEGNLNKAMELLRNVKEACQVFDKLLNKIVLASCLGNRMGNSIDWDWWMKAKGTTKTTNFIY